MQFLFTCETEKFEQNVYKSLCDDIRLNRDLKEDEFYTVTFIFPEITGEFKKHIKFICEKYPQNLHFETRNGETRYFYDKIHELEKIPLELLIGLSSIFYTLEMPGYASPLLEVAMRQNLTLEELEERVKNIECKIRFDI